MSDFRTLKGLYIKHVSSDPSNLVAGDIWYNTTTQTLKVAPQIGAWASGGDKNNNAYNTYSGGTQTAMFGAGGYNPALPHLAVVAKTEEYDGSSWTNSNDMGSARYSGHGCGTQTAGLATGGTLSSGNASLLNEEYNGSTWTEAGDINTGHGWGVMAGLQTAALIATGLSDPSPAARTTNAESYDGTSWTEGPNTNTARYEVFGFGTSTAMIAIGGEPNRTIAETYNGTSWTEGTDIPQGRQVAGASGVLTAGMYFGGANPTPALVNTTFTYDGTNWTAGPNLATASNSGNKGESETGNSSAIYFGRSPTPLIAATEEYNDVATTRSVDTT